MPRQECGLLLDHVSAVGVPEPCIDFTNFGRAESTKEEQPEPEDVGWEKTSLLGVALCEQNSEKESAGEDKDSRNLGIIHLLHQLY